MYLTDDAKIVDDYPKYAGMDRYEARKAIVEDLDKEGYLVKIEDHEHNVGTCYRCQTTVEPMSIKTVVCKDGRTCKTCN